MASYKPSRATSNTTIKSRYNPLNSTSISYSVYQTNTILPPIHTKYTLNKKGNTSSQPTQINNTNESTKWNFGGIIQSVWSNVIKPTISNDNNTQNNSSQPITPITHPINGILYITKDKSVHIWPHQVSIQAESLCRTGDDITLIAKLWRW
eukprot:492074_1